MANDITLFKSPNAICLKKVSKKEEITSSDPNEGYLIDTNGNEKETRRIVDRLKGKKLVIAIQGHNNNFNRRVLETMKVNYLISPEKLEKKDTLKQRDSGMNHITARIAKNNKIALVFDFNELKTLKPYEKALRLSRIIQNIKITRKAGCEIKIASFAKNKNELISNKDREIFLQSLKASTIQTKNSSKF